MVHSRIPGGMDKMKAINVALVAVGSISALLLCWNSHDPAKAHASQPAASVRAMAAEIDIDSTVATQAICCQASTAQAISVCANHTECSVGQKDPAGCAVTYG